MRDMKEALSSARKPDITHMRTPFLAFGSRACEYGGVKYERANYLRPTGGSSHTFPTAADFERLRAYLRAAISHIAQTLDSMEAHQANDPTLLDTDGLKAASYAADLDPDASGKVGPSRLPHLCGAVASLNMAITQAAACGLLPADPGQPWASNVELHKPVVAARADTVPSDLSGLAARESQAVPNRIEDDNWKPSGMGGVLR